MNETVRLAEFAAELRYEDLPPAVVQALKVYILDNLAAGLVGSGTPWAQMVMGLARKSAPTGACSLFAQRETTSPAYAALVNGTMIGGFEVDHAFVAGSCHPSASVFPAILAVAEHDHLDGTTFLVAMAAGYEVTCRVGLAATRAVEDQRGFHGPGTNAPFGGAAGAGRAMGLDRDRFVHALGIAGSHGAGLLEFAKEGAMTKRIHVARGAQTGLESALLAAEGFTGPTTVLEGDHGFLRVYSPSPQPELLVEDLGKRYHLLDILVKAYPCHGSFHAVIEAIWRFRQNHPLKAGGLETVRIVGSERMMEERLTAGEPTSVLGAQYSLPFSAAIALCRDAGDPRSFSEETLWDPEVRSLAKRIELAVDSERFGVAWGAGAEVSLTIGGSSHVLTATDWKGAPTDHYSYPEMADKFRRYAAPYLTPTCQEEIIAKVDRLEQEEDIGKLAGLLHKSG